MHRKYLAATSLLLTVVMTSSSWAGGNVLLPSSNDSSTSSSSASSTFFSLLGLAPSPKPAPDSSATSPPNGTQGTTAAKPVNSPPELTVTPNTVGSTPAAGRSPYAGAGAAANASSVITPLNKPGSVKLPPGKDPTQIVHTPDISAALASFAKSLPYSLTLSIDGKSVFGAKDVTEITTKLGLTREQIPSSCVLTVRGFLQTDKSTYIIDGPASPQATIYYDGIIQQLPLTATAYCTVTQLPPGSGYVYETNGRYKANLQPITCPPPTRQATQLNIVYDGTAAAKCLYQ